MKFNRPKVPIGMPIAAGTFIILGLVAGPAVRSMTEDPALASNVLLSALPFILIFVGIILTYMTLIWALASALNGQIARRTYEIIEYVAIGGIVLGIVAMFQPFQFVLYKYGFLVLLLSTLFFILWSHIRPRGAYDVPLGTVSVAEIEQKDLEG